jgi:hypothetical protein
MAMTVHWFFTFGTNPRDARYRLQHDHARQTNRKFVTTALLEMGWPVPIDTQSDVQLHLFETSGLAGTKPIFVAELTSVAPLLAARPAGPFASEMMLGELTQDTIWQVVRHVLDTVRDGDKVVLESTNGLRSINIGALLAAGLLISLRREVEVLAVTYAELSSGISDITNLLPFFQLFEWSHAVRAMAGYLDPTPMLSLLERDSVAFSGQQALGELGASLALNWPVEIDRALRAWVNASTDEGAGRASVPASLALAAAVDELASLLEPMRQRNEPPTRLDQAHLEFELQLIERLIAAQRAADAARGVREWMVNVVLFGWNLHAEWLNQAVRARAERALHGLSPNGPRGAVRTLWDDAGRMRNAVSHLGYNEKHQVTPEELRAFLETAVQRLRQHWDEDGFKLPGEVPEIQRLIANAFSVNMLRSADRSVTFKTLARNKACEQAKGRASVVGHADTAKIFSAQLGLPVAFNRETVKLDSGDTVLLGQYEGPRLAEGTTTLPAGASITWILVTIL